MNDKQTALLIAYLASLEETNRRQSEAIIEFLNWLKERLDSEYP